MTTVPLTLLDLSPLLPLFELGKAYHEAGVEYRTTPAQVWAVLKRERKSYARGDQFMRYAWADVFEDARAMLTEVCGLLRR